MASIKTDPFQAAIDKAHAMHPAVVQALGTRAGVQTWSVQGSTRGMWYIVHSGAAGCTCDCRAGQQNKPCYHRAAVLLNKLATDAADLFLAALDASIASRVAEQDAKLQEIVGAWYAKHYSQKEPPMPPTCKACEKRAAGVTGLCQPCLMVQEALRKSEEELPSLPDGWEINEEGAGYVARFNGCAILTRSYRNIQRFKSWHAARHAIDNQMHEEAKEETRKAQACTRMAAHVNDDKAFSIFKVS